MTDTAWARDRAKDAIYKGWQDCKLTNYVGQLGRPCDCDIGSVVGCKAHNEAFEAALIEAIARGKGQQAADDGQGLLATIARAEAAEAKLARLKEPDAGMVEALARTHAEWVFSQYDFAGSLFDEYTPEGRATALAEVRANLSAIAAYLETPPAEDNTDG